MIVMKIFNRFEKFYPYEQCSLLMKIQTIARAVILKLFVFDNWLYPDISLVGYLKKLKGLKGNKEFLVKYKESQKDFEELWGAKPRTTKTEVESFYNEHDKDVWRQVYLSKYDRTKKNYVLWVYKLVNSLFKDRNVKILDYGCGCGNFGHYFYKKGYKDITLADIKSGTFQFIKDAFGPTFKYIEIDSDAPLKEIYDVILFIDAQAHAFNPFEITKHIIEHLNKGGLLVVNYEGGPFRTHLARAAEQRDKTIAYMYEKCHCLKKEVVFIKL